MYKEYDYIIVGAGLCGLVLAKELSKRNKRVLILEKGGYLNYLGSIIPAFFFYDQGALSRSKQGVIIYRVFGVGGTSVVSCGNAVEFTDEEYNKIGINLKGELGEAKKDTCVREGGFAIGKASQKIMETANKLGYDMRPMPKFNIDGRCASCGNCYFGCSYNLKWSSKDCLKDIKDKVTLFTGFSVEKVLESDGKAVGVEGRNSGFMRKKFYAGKIILSAGGIGTPIILQNSDLEAGNNLFVDLFNVTYGLHRNFNQRKELSMSVVCDKFHKSDGFVMAPYIDNWFSFASGVKPREIPKVLRLNKLMGIMTKIADDNVGRVYRSGKIDKSPTENDLKKLKKGSDIAKEILLTCGVEPRSIVIAKPKGAHPGGTAAIGSVVGKNLETKMKNLYVCDASVLPFAPGLPPMLSLVALTKWFVKKGLEG